MNEGHEVEFEGVVGHGDVHVVDDSEKINEAGHVVNGEKTEVSNLVEDVSDARGNSGGSTGKNTEIGEDFDLGSGVDRERMIDGGGHEERKTSGKVNPLGENRELKLHIVIEEFGIIEERELRPIESFALDKGSREVFPLGSNACKTHIRNGVLVDRDKEIRRASSRGTETRESAVQSVPGLELFARLERIVILIGIAGGKSREEKIEFEAERSFECGPGFGFLRGQLG